MKRGILYCLFIFAPAVFAQDMTGITRTEHFEILSDQNDGERIADEMEARFTAYNRLFRFDPSALSAPLLVRVFSEWKAYNAYVAAKLPDMPPHAAMPSGAVYLHYRDQERRELVINRDSDDEGREFSYQAFLQFFRAFVPNPPAWMREGFAVYFDTLKFTDNRELSFAENLAWLETVKSMENPPAPEAILLADNRNLPENFQSLAWSLASFFLNSGKETYTRSLTDSFMALSGSGTAEENTSAVMKRIGLWNRMEDMTRDYQSYLDSRKTFAELIDLGQRAYAAGDKAGAERDFQAALNQKTDHYIPYYYLGLLAYGKGDYAPAEDYYFTSLGYGADQALILYALGLNAFADGRNSEAEDYLSQAAETAPDRYRNKAECVLSGPRKPKP
jgi:tetratricopeptide (TPR) repeat protein